MMSDNPRSHKYKPGQRVLVLLKDWTPDQAACSKTVEGTVLHKITQPFGYDVKLRQPVTFRGNTPFPLLADNDASYDDSRDAVRMSVMFVKEFNMTKVHNRLREVLAKKFSELVFKVIGTIHTKPAAHIEYINYYQKDGTVVTLSDDRQLFNDAESEEQKEEIKKRLSYKLTHFYGFTRPNNPIHETRNYDQRETLHFTMNRFSEVSFMNGFEWLSIDSSIPKLPEVGQIICGRASQHVEKKAPSFDNWFISSPQFMRLVALIRNRQTPRTMSKMSEAEIIESLTIPKNTDNYYVAHEKPISRHIYAAIYMLAVKGDDNLPAKWNLPERNIGDKKQPFEVWWPNILMSR